MIYQFRPLDRWPYEETHSRRSKWTFKAGWSDTISRLERELAMLLAQNIVLQVDVDPSRIRQDGMLYANAIVNHPGVIISFDSEKSGSLMFPCDSCEDWQHNVRSIALGLEALRAVDRYGVTRRAEQYKGWAKLPDPTGKGALWEVPTTLAAAMSLICQLSEESTLDPIEALTLAKKFQIKFHPDRHSGDPRMSRAINAAVDLLSRGAV